ncbi:conserved hypothetical protein [Chthoniobacter flavus Ellin428]|uniref:DUF2314 domain-containing protein n=1 Tax=Chthoniobacter flavus Ellin428 TaxID=497964 RepID=B4D0P0_9BACT|nr:DUF2314 domain-containing protein [Chthoniobacter flavus]EDY19902.1 conserved hypothetical protein [Chthoniobacter flavus Ellin428]TCO91827.1 uncharacterized protein YegJ (DUF2314 family) [Chthoniobacter flavus]
MSEPVYMFDGAEPAMHQAYVNAQKSFRYFWRELSWEHRRIVPGLDMSMVKMPFTDGPRTDGKPAYEHMWVGEVDFDGETISGKLLNSPNWLTSVRERATIRLPFPKLEDWMMVVQGKAYGGYTVNVVRAKMGASQRKEHDAAWGLDFGDPAVIRTEIGERAEKPKRSFFESLFGSGKTPTPDQETFRDHPMCVNMLGKIEEQLKGDGSIARSTDHEGWTLLQREALAGNLGVVKLLVRYGADVTAKAGPGRTASELARGIGWSEIADFLYQSALN